MIDVPIAVEDGPSYVVRLRANLTKPELAITGERTDFGEVIVGQCRTVTLQLYNPKVRLSLSVFLSVSRVEY
jgi:hydrocephalus-inducing protein